MNSISFPRAHEFLEGEASLCLTFDMDSGILASVQVKDDVSTKPLPMLVELPFELHKQLEDEFAHAFQDLNATAYPDTAFRVAEVIFAFEEGAPVTEFIITVRNPDDLHAEPFDVFPWHFLRGERVDVDRMFDCVLEHALAKKALSAAAGGAGPDGVNPARAPRARGL